MAENSFELLVFCLQLPSTGSMGITPHPALSSVSKQAPLFPSHSATLIINSLTLTPAVPFPAHFLATGTEALKLSTQQELFPD